MPIPAIVAGTLSGGIQDPSTLAESADVGRHWMPESSPKKLREGASVPKNDPTSADAAYSDTAKNLQSSPCTAINGETRLLKITDKSLGCMNCF